MYVRVGKVNIDEVLPFVCDHKDRVKKEYLGYEIKMWSQRYQTFQQDGVVCRKCGLTATYFAIEKHAHQKIESYHLNLYAMFNDKEVMMTKDHIIPVSKGGKNMVKNYQTMCIACNEKKGNKI